MWLLEMMLISVVVGTGLGAGVFFIERWLESRKS